MNETSNKALAGIIVCSDRAAQGVYRDESGNVIHGWLGARGYNVRNIHIVPDDPEPLTEALSDHLEGGADLIVVSGGTGLGPRDVTPQVLERQCDYLIPGIGEVLRSASSAYSRHAWLSRCGGWVKGTCLILALPGKPKAVKEQLDVVGDLLPHAMHVLRGGGHDDRTERFAADKGVHS